MPAEHVTADDLARAIAEGQAREEFWNDYDPPPTARDMLAVRLMVAGCLGILGGIVAALVL